MSLIRSGAALCSRASSSSYYASSIVCRSFHSLTTAAQRHGLTCRCCTLSASFSTISPAEEQFRKTLEGEKKEAQADYDKRMNIARTIAGPNVDINVHGDGELKSTDRVKRLINELSQLSIVEFKFVMDGVADKLGLPQPSKMMAFGGGFGGGAPAPAAPAAAAAAAGGAAPAAAAAAAPAKAAPAADKKSFNVRLDKFADKDKIKVIKEVRTATGLGLKESKDLVESLSSGPKTLKKDLKKEEAEALIAKLKEAGAEASLE